MTSKIRLLLSDIDGTLVPQDKVLTARSMQAVDKMREAGIRFAVTSSRPPRGVTMFFKPLKLTTPIAAFNGAMIVDTDMHVLEERTIDNDLVGATIGVLQDHDVSVWVYQGQEWYVIDVAGPHVQHEAFVTQFEPQVVANFNAVSHDVAKIVGVSDDTDAVVRARTALQSKVGERVSATNSQPYYLDITNPDANKGAVVDYLSDALDIPLDAIATIGDAHNDVPMFKRSGLSIAMGNAQADVQASANEVTTSNEDEGFARAVERFILS